MKILAKLAGIENYHEMTSYVIRHTFATSLKKMGYSYSQIQECYQHDSEQITKIYINDFDNYEVKKINEDFWKYFEKQSNL